MSVSSYDIMRLSLVWSFFYVVFFWFSGVLGEFSEGFIVIGYKLCISDYLLEYDWNDILTIVVVIALGISRSCTRMMKCWC